MIEAILATTVGGLLLMLVQKYFSFQNRLSFLGYPQISGDYKVEYYGDPTCSEVVNIKQFGSRITGLVKVDGSQVEYSIVGNVARSRYITYQVFSKDSNYNYLGAVLLKLNQPSNEAHGFLLFVGKDDLPVSYQGRIVKL